MNRDASNDDAYEGLKLIHKGEDSLIHRGVRRADGVRVLRKSLRARHPTPEQRARQRHEYSLLAEFDSPRIVRVLSLDHGPNGPVITLEDDARTTLSSHLENKQISISEFFDISLSLVEALGEVHEHKIVHKDINPENILWCPQTKQAQIFDFGIANRIAREYSTCGDVHALEGTLAYIAPEQTGRTNRTIDWRVDFYGLGTTLFETLYGRPPFQAADAMGMVHAHLAMQPAPPENGRSDIPDALWKLLATLLAKSADDRYQSSRGIAQDLERIRLTPSDTSALSGITVTDRFELPSRLYGRSKELKVLGDAYRRVSDGRTGVVAIRGSAGTGKSALATELGPVVAEGGGHFVSGKFDRYQHDMPYAPLMQAARTLLRQVLAGSDDRLRAWRKRILKAVGANGALIIEIIPELASLIGEQEQPAYLSVDEAKNRFRVLLVRFFQSLGTTENPLILFVDDLQWADLGSLELIRSLLTHNETLGFLLIAAFRDDEITATHPLHSMLDEIAQDGVRTDTIVPDSLGIDDTIVLVSDATHRSTRDSGELAEFLLQRTGGRPFFLRESLLAAYESGVIRYDPEISAFNWDMAGIRSLSTHGELGPLLVERIGRMPLPTQHALGIASCVGATFDLHTLALIDDREVADVATELEPAFEAGLIWGLGSWHFPEEKDGSPSQTDSGLGLCRFVHDEVQATAYELVDEDARLARHLHIARILEERFDECEHVGGIFELVHQIRLAIGGVTDPEEKLRYAKLYLLASRKAAESAAFATASRFVAMGRSLLPQNPWHSEYALWIEMSRIGAEAAALSDNKEMLDDLVSAVQAHAVDVLDQTDVLSAQISYYVAHLQPAEALRVAHDALEPLGVVLPKKASLMHVAGSLIRTLWAMRGKSTRDLENLPQMTDPVHLAAMRILLRTISPAYIADPNMFPLIVLHMVRLSLRHGNSIESPFGFVTYGILLSAGLGQLDKGTELGQFSLRLASKDASNSVKAKLAVSFYVTLHHWKNHLSETLAPLLAGHHAGLETGDIEYACHSAWYYCNYLTWSGETLDEVAAIQSNLIAAIDEHNSEFHSVCGRIFHQLVSSLTDDTEGPLPQQLIGDAFDERTDVAGLIESNNLTALFCYNQCRAALNYYLGNFGAAMRHGLAALKFEQNVLGSINVAQNTFYLALATMREYQSMNAGQRFLARRRINGYRRRLKRWGREGPATYAHKHEMVEGEWQCVRGKGELALACFDKAQANARAGHFVQDEALATELMARCQISIGMPLAAEGNMRTAWGAWLSWGSLAKATQLESEFPKWLDRATSPNMTLLSATNKRKSTGGTDNLAHQLDVTSTLKASQAMVEEIVLESLLDKLMHILIENAGAQTGALMLNDDGVAHLRATGNVDTGEYSVVDSVPLHDNAANLNGIKVPLRVIDYVWRSGEIVVLDDAASDARFSEDPNIHGRSPLSALAAPLEHRGRLVGAIYLENSRTPAAFTEARVSMIQVLAAQAAISIQNARLYRDLKNQANDLSELNRSLGRFVPNQFLASLGHNSVTSVKLGENTHREMSVLFSDIRGFTTLVESLEPNAHVDFINEYLSYMEPAIVDAGGFVDSYIGDAIMALFDSADDAVLAALKMTENLRLLNETRAEKEQPAMRVGIGVSTGPLTLGTIGGPRRIKCGVIGDTVNLAARVESLTPTYGASLLISHHTKERLSSDSQLTLRQMERVTVKGQSQPVTLFEVLEAAPEEDRHAKMSVLEEWTTGMEAFYAQDFAKASECFGKAASSCSGDLAARRFVSNCWRYLDDGVPSGWDGVVALDHK